ncbi:MAG: zinc-finger-containing protein [Bacillus sp. (in: firmicutes)]
MSNQIIVICPYCNTPSIFMSSKEFYANDYKTNLYVCSPCDAYVGTHGNTRQPLGTLANRNLREMRKRAHSLFDPLWKKRKMSRSAAYSWMQQVMDLPPEKAHIGMFNIEQCEKLISLVKQYRNIK